jgi:4-diphosphocytidyl-2-C-methyl-D-erythritol kinase
MPGIVNMLAPAKLNLALSVGPAGEGGMHPICSWMVTIDLCDELTVTRLQEGFFSRYAILWHREAPRRSDIDWPIASDLAVRAHLALEKHVARALPVQLKLEKRIPVGGGLGGGSSNAAAMLRAVNELYQLGLSTDDLIAIAATLGSDVPFFVRGGSAIVEGLGERLAARDSTPLLHAVVAMPAVRCPTGPVYQKFDAMTTPRLDPTAVRALAARDGARLDSAAFFNDLAAPAAEIQPALARHRRDLAALAEREAHVAGSGSSLFVVCDDPIHALALADAVTARLGLPAVAVRAMPPVQV